MWWKGQCGSTFIYLFGEPGRGLSGAATMTRYLVAREWVGIGMVRGGAAWAAQVATFDMSGGGGESVWATRRERLADLMVKAASSKVASGRGGATWPAPLAGLGVRVEGLVMGCLGPLRVPWSGSRHEFAWSGLVQTGRARALFEMLRFAVDR